MTQVIPLLSIYPKELKAGTGTDHTSLFMAELLAITKKWKEPKCPSAEDRQNIVGVYYGILLSFEKEGNPVKCYNMDEA